MKKKNIFNLIYFIAFIFGFYFLFLRPFFSPNVPERLWMKPWNFQEYKYSFCTYEIPKGIKFHEYTYGDNGKREYVILRSKDEASIIILIKFDEFKYVNLSKIDLSSESVRMTTNNEQNLVLKHLKITYLWPFFKTDQVSLFGNDLTLRGIKVKSKEAINTGEYDGLYIRGGFEKIGFYKKPLSFFKKLIVPVVDFEIPVDGALAVVNNKTNNETLFVIGVSGGQSNPFNESMFKQFLKTISFHNTNRPPFPETNYKQIQTQWGPIQTSKEYLNGKEIKK